MKPLSQSEAAALSRRIEDLELRAAVSEALHHSRCTMAGIQTRHIRGPRMAHHVETRRFLERLETLGFGIVPNAAKREADWEAEMAAVDARLASAEPPA